MCRFLGLGVFGFSKSEHSTKLNTPLKAQEAILSSARGVHLFVANDRFFCDLLKSDSVVTY